MSSKKTLIQRKSLDLLYVLSAGFIIISGFSTIFASLYNFGIKREISNYQVKGAEAEINEVKKQPIIGMGVEYPDLSAYSVLAVDLDSEKELYEKNSKNLFLPASTTKIMTALVAMDYYNPQEVLTVGSEIGVEGQKMNLVLSEQIKVEDLLYGLLVYSANDAAEVLAANYPGGRSSFVASMNLKAREIGMLSSSFKNPSGLDEQGHVVTAEDLVKLSEVAMENPYFKKIVGTKAKTVTSIDAKFSHRLVNLNELLGKVDGVLGVKTGWTENAKENLVTYVERNGEKIIIVVLGSQDRFGETQTLIEWIFANYQWKYL